ncbi:MAG: tyrosine-protein phosphatase [Ruthenibacterium sp.]
MMHFPKPGTPLPFESCENFRELGGYVGLDGKTVKHGAFYRTGALSHITTPHDKALLESLGIKTVLDFRSQPERDAQPDPVLPGAQNIAVSAIFDENGKELRFDLDEVLAAGRAGVDEMLRLVRESYVRMPFANPAFRRMFAEIAAGNTPLLFHCSAGKDRTGVAAALILRALGVSRADILHDYCITNGCRAKSRVRFEQQYSALLPAQGAEELLQCVLGVEEKCLAEALDAIDARYADFEAYLRAECVFSAEALAAMRADYLLQP